MNRDEVRGVDPRQQQQERSYDTCNSASRPRTVEEEQDYRLQRMAHRVKYHAPNAEQLPKYQALRDAAFVFSLTMIRNVPGGSDLENALATIEMALMIANKGIALG